MARRSAAGAAARGRNRRRDLRAARARRRRTAQLPAALPRAVRRSCSRPPIAWPGRRRFASRTSQTSRISGARIAIRGGSGRGLRAPGHRRPDRLPERARRLGAGDGGGRPWLRVHAGIRARTTPVWWRGALIEPEIWREVALVTLRGRPNRPGVGALVREVMRMRWIGAPAQPGLGRGSRPAHRRAPRRDSAALSIRCKLGISANTSIRCSLCIDRSAPGTA